MRMTLPSRPVVAAAAAVALAWWACPVSGAAPPILSVDAIGFDGRVRMAAWTPLWIEVHAPASGVDGLLTLIAASPVGSPTVQQAVPVRAAPGATLRVFIPAMLYDSRAPGVVMLAGAQRRLASISVPKVTPADDLVVILSEEPLGLETVTARGERLDIAYLSPEDLPQVWQAYEGVRLLVVRNLDERRLDEPQRRALQQWVWAGGRLLVMPSSDDVRHFVGATLRDLTPLAVTSWRLRAGASPTLAPRPGSEPVRAPGGGARWRAGRGRVTAWAHDAGDVSVRGSPEDRRAWAAVLADAPSVPAFDLEATLPPQRSVPARTQALIGALIVGYIAVARRLSRLAAGLRAPAIVTAVMIVFVATLLAARVAVFARADASGVVASAVVEGMPGTRHALVAMAARMVVSHPGAFAIEARREVLLRPVPAADATVVYDERTLLRSGAPGLRLAGLGLAPLEISGRFIANDDAGTLSVENRTGARLDPAWVYQGGRVQAVGAIGASAQVALDPQRWLARDRLQRTDPNHALLMWAFSRLESDAILKSTPTWLVGWLRDAAFSLRWEGRTEVTPHLVLVPLTAP